MSEKLKNSIGPLAFFLVLIGFTVGGFSLADSMKNDQVQAVVDNGEIADAVLVNKVTEKMFREVTYYLVYEFENGNQMREQVGIDVFNSVTTGGEVQVCYNDNMLTAFVETCGGSELKGL